MTSSTVLTPLSRGINQSFSSGATREQRLSAVHHYKSTTTNTALQTAGPPKAGTPHKGVGSQVVLTRIDRPDLRNVVPVAQRFWHLNEAIVEANARMEFEFPTPLVDRLRQALQTLQWDSDWILSRLDTRLHVPGFIQEHIFTSAPNDDLNIPLYDRMSDFSIALILQNFRLQLRRRSDVAQVLEDGVANRGSVHNRGLTAQFYGEEGDRTGGFERGATGNNYAQAQWETARSEYRSFCVCHTCRRGPQALDTQCEHCGGPVVINRPHAEDAAAYS